MAHPRICVARCLGPSVPSAHLIAYEQMWKKGVHHEIRTTNVPVYRGRNEAVSMFFRSIPVDDFLVFFDTDIVMPPDTLLRLVAHDLPVVGGLYVMDKPPFHPLLFRKMGKILTMDQMFGETGNMEVIQHWDEGATIKVDGIGMGCTAIRRDVLEKIPYPWFSFEKGTEDLWFCHLAQLAGFPIHCDTSIVCGHLKMETIGLAHFRMWRDAKQKGLKEPPPEKIAYVSERTWIADAEYDEQPKVQMHYVERDWTEDTTPGERMKDGIR